MAIQVCPNCKKTITANRRVCPHCKQDLTLLAQKSRKKQRSFLAALLALLGLRRDSQGSWGCAAVPATITVASIVLAIFLVIGPVLKVIPPFAASKAGGSSTASNVTGMAQTSSGQQSFTPGTVAPFNLPATDHQPVEITAGPDGNLWFTEEGGSAIGRITPQGTIAEFPLPAATNTVPNPNGITPVGGAVGITDGPDGNLWFTDFVDGAIGKITPAGAITEFPTPTSSSEPASITSGPDGNLWFTENASNQIGRITPDGTITEFPVSASMGTPSEDSAFITRGPDDNLWFTISGSNEIGQITTGGTVTTFPISASPLEIVTGPDGNLWFTESAKQIGRITPSGTISYFPIPADGGFPFGIARGPDGNLWFLQEAGDNNQLGRITPAGVVTEFPLPAGTPGPVPYLGIASGPNNTLWYIENGTGQVCQVPLN